MNHPTRTLVVTGCSQDMLEIHKKTWPSKQAWAEDKGYDFMDVRSFRRPDPRHVVWQKMDLLRLLSTNSYYHYDWIIWLDADAIITNPDYRLEDFTEEGKATFYVPGDWSSPDQKSDYYFNTGNFIIKNGPFTPTIFHEWYDVGMDWLDRFGYEQSSLQELKHKYDTDPEFTEYKGQIRRIPGIWLNAVPNKCHPGKPNDTPWDPSCFLAHLSGVPNERRLQLLNMTPSLW